VGGLWLRDFRIISFSHVLCSGLGVYCVFVAGVMVGFVGGFVIFRCLHAVIVVLG